ncbi:MAG: hypothetical protein PUE91_10000 [Clostridiales bacterium]|nr:hypothetical protein [Clostridiales bacterium]
MAIRTPIKAIRAKCLDCCCDSAREVRLCPVQKCPLYEYRLGHRPKAEGYDTLADEAEKNTALSEDLEGRT